MRRVQFLSNGRTLSFLQLGKGEPVVCLSGLAGVSDDWSMLSQQLVATRTVVAVDLPGCGWAGPGAARVDGLAEVERLAELMAELDLGPAVVVGHSMGGFIAELFARCHPELVSRLLLLDSSVELEPHPGGSHPRAEAWAARVARHLLGPARRVSDALLRRRSHLPSDLSCSAEATFRRPVVADGVVAWWCSYQALAQQVTEARRARPLSVPTTVIAATRRNGDTRWIRRQRELATQLGASFEVVHHSGHRVQLERPQVVASLIAAG